MAPSPRSVVRFIWRSSKRIAVTIVGAVLVAAGLVMMVLPGPGIAVILLGLVVLATEYVWAATALERAKGMAQKGGNVATGALRSARRRVGRSAPE
jgi:uncharacterized protein (TIGR02611 family)